MSLTLQTADTETNASQEQAPIHHEEGVLTADQVALRDQESGILIEGYRRDLTKITGFGPLANQLVLRDQAFLGGGVGMSFLASFTDARSGEEVQVHVKFLEDDTEIAFLRAIEEAQAGIDLYEGRHAQPLQSSFAPPRQPFILPRLISLERVGPEGIEPFQRHTAGRLMLVTERVENGEDLNPRDAEGNPDFFETRLEAFLDNPTLENAEKIKEWALFRKTKRKHFAFDNAVLNSGTRVYELSDPQHTFSEDESFEIMGLFKQDLVVVTARIGVQLTDVLQKVHESGRVHQDLKPDNVMLDDRGRLRLIDFGFSKENDGKNPNPAERVGTPLYWSLKYLQTGVTNEQTEMWAVGLMIVEMLTGQKVIDDFESARDLMNKLMRFDLETYLEDHPGRIPEELVEILQIALRKDEEHRFESMAEFSLELRQFLMEFNPRLGEMELDKLRWLQ